MLGHKDKNNKFHPHNSVKGGVSEKDLNISQKGNNDTIVVEPSKTKSMKGNREEKLLDRIKVEFKDDGYGAYFDDDKEKGEERQKYKVTVQLNGKSFTFPFGDSIHNTQEGRMPFNSKEENEKYKKDILELITSDYYSTKEYYPSYHDFAQEFGYAEDSRKGEKIYHNVLKQAEGLHRVFTDKEIEEIRKELGL